MKHKIQKPFSFIVRSMLWSLLLYVVLMLTFNWDDVSNALTGKNPITVVTGNQQAPQNPGTGNPMPDAIPKHATVVKGILTIMKTITGVAHVSVAN